MQTLPRLLLLGWSTLRMEQPSMFIFSWLRSIAESKKVSDKHRISKLWVLIKSSIKGTLMKSWAARPFKFQWQNSIR